MLLKDEKIFKEKKIDEVKNYWNSRPCNLRHSQKSIGSKEYFEEVEARKFFVEPHLVEFANFPSVKGKKVLEIGCGLGTTTINFAKFASKVTAVDLSDKSIELAKKRAEVYGLSDKIDFLNCNAEELSNYLPLQEYDLIFSFGVIHHSPNPDKILSELHKFLKPSGQLKVMVYYRYSWKVLWIMLKYGKFQFWNIAKHVAKYSEAQTGCPITYSYSESDAKKLFQNEGFKIVEMSPEHIFPYKINDYVQYKYVKNWYFRILPNKFFRYLEKKFGWHLCITAVKN